MKSTEETRLRFKERLTEALAVVPDSDELTEAMTIVDDLNELLEVSALAAEYFYHKNLSSSNSYYDDDDDDDYGQTHDGYNMKKMYEYLIHRFDLFLGIGVHGGVWKNSKHWIAVQMEKLKTAATSNNMGFTGSHSNPQIVNHHSPYVISQGPGGFGSIWNPPSSPIIASKKTPPPTTYMIQLREIIRKATNSKGSTINVVHKTNGDFELSSSRGKIYLIHNYVASTVTIKDDKRKKLKVLVETDLDKIALFVGSLLV
jgi:hypothetical protein